MKRELLILGFCFFSLSSCGKAISEDQGETTVTSSVRTRETKPFRVRPGKVTIWNRAVGYNCAVFLPKSYLHDGNRHYPMVLSLHGYNGSVLNLEQTDVGGNRMGFIKQVWNTELADTYEAIVIAPHVYPVGSSENQLWNRDQLRELIIEATLAFRVDPDRIVATGLSSGSIATQELLRYSKDLLAGGMPGAFQYIYPSNHCQFAEIPVWSFGNDSDEMYDQRGWRQLQQKIETCTTYTHAFKLTIAQNTCRHGCWDIHWSRPAVQKWLIEQVR